MKEAHGSCGCGLQPSLTLGPTRELVHSQPLACFGPAPLFPSATAQTRCISFGYLAMTQRETDSSRELVGFLLETNQHSKLLSAAQGPHHISRGFGTSGPASAMWPSHWGSTYSVRLHTPHNKYSGCFLLKIVNTKQQPGKRTAERRSRPDLT